VITIILFLLLILLLIVRANIYCICALQVVTNSPPIPGHNSVLILTQPLCTQALCLLCGSLGSDQEDVRVFICVCCVSCLCVEQVAFLFTHCHWITLRLKFVVYSCCIVCSCDISFYCFCSSPWCTALCAVSLTTLTACHLVLDLLSTSHPGAVFDVSIVECAAWRMHL